MARWAVITRCEGERGLQRAGNSGRGERSCSVRAVLVAALAVRALTDGKHAMQRRARKRREGSNSGESGLADCCGAVATSACMHTPTSSDATRTLCSEGGGSSSRHAAGAGPSPRPSLSRSAPAQRHDQLQSEQKHGQAAPATRTVVGA